MVPVPITVSFDKDLKDLVDLAPSTEQLALGIQALRNTQAILGVLSILEKKMALIDDLAAQVHANTDVIASANTLIQGFAQRLDDATAAAKAGDLTQLEAFRSEIAAADAKLAAAVAANTRAAPAPAVDTATTPPVAVGTTADASAAPADAPAPAGPAATTT